MGEKMLITQALTEKETLQDEICRLIQESKFCFADTICEREEKTQQRKLNETEFSRNAQELFEKIQEKIKRYYQIEEAIIVSNAKVKIHTQAGDFTVTGAVSLRNRLRGKSAYQNSLFEVNMERKMDQEYTRSVQQIKNMNLQLEERADAIRLSILGKDSKGKGDNSLDSVNDFRKENTMELVDPLDIKTLIEENEAKRNALLSELDTRLKVSNATTFIEI